MQKCKMNPNNQNLKGELEHIIVEITRLVSDKNRDKIYEQFQKLDQSEGENFANGIWTLKKKEFPPFLLRSLWVMHSPVIYKMKLRTAMTMKMIYM